MLSPLIWSPGVPLVTDHYRLIMVAASPCTGPDNEANYKLVVPLSGQQEVLARSFPSRPVKQEDQVS